MAVGADWGKESGEDLENPVGVRTYGVETTKNEEVSGSLGSVAQLALTIMW